MSRRLRRRVCVALWIVCCGCWSAVYAQERLGPYTLNDIVQLALRLNEDVLIAEQDVEKAEGQIVSAWSEALPSFSLNGLYGRHWRVPTSVINGTEFRFGSTNVFTAGASLSIPIYRGGKAGAARRGAHALRESSEFRLTRTRQGVAFETQQAFYHVLLADEMVRVHQAAVDRAEAHLRQVAQLHQAGKASEYEMLRARVQVSNRKPALITAYNDQELAMLRLKRIIGLDLTTPLDIEGALADALAEQSPVGGDVDAAVRLALQNRPDFMALDHEIKMREDAVRMQAAGKRPTLSLVNTYQNQAQINDIGALSTDRFVQSYATQLVVDIPIFDGRKSRGEVRQAQADLTAATHAKQQARKRIELEVREAFMRMAEARERLAAYEETVTEAEKGLEIAQVRYRAGLGTQLEVLDAQNVVTEARANYAQGVYDYGVSAANLRWVTGVVKGRDMSHPK